MNREKLIQVVDGLKKKHAAAFQRPVSLKPAQMSNALKKIVCDPEVGVGDIVALMDTTFMGSGKRGFLLTSQYLYAGSGTPRVVLDGLVSCEMRKGSLLFLTYRDGTQTELNVSIYDELADLFWGIIQVQEGASGQETEARERETGRLTACLKAVLREKMSREKEGQGEREAPARQEIAIQQKAVRQETAVQQEDARQGLARKAAAQEQKDLEMQEFRAQAEAVWAETFRKEAAQRQAVQEQTVRGKAEQERQRAAQERVEQERQRAAQERAEQERQKAAREKAAQERQRAAREEAERQKAGQEIVKQAEALRKKASYAWDEDPKMAVRCLQEAVRLGNSEAFYDLAEAYCYGWGGECDVREAKRLYGLAAQRGIHRAAEALEFIKEYEQKEAEELYCLADDRYAEPDDVVLYAQLALERGLDAERYIELQEQQAYEYCRKEQYFYAFPWVYRAARQGSAESQYQLGILYLFGEGWEQDEGAAKEWFQKAAANGHAKARAALEGLEEAQRGIERIETSKSVFLSSPQMLLEIAKSAYNKGRYIESYGMLSYLVRKGSKEKTKAQELIAEMYQTGHGPLQCRWKARSLYETLSEEGSYLAQFELGEIYWKERQYEAAADQYEKSAEQRFGPAQIRLADLYMEGAGREKDMAKAAYWYEEAADSGIRRAQETISQMYRKGIGVRKEKSRAKYWADRAAGGPQY